MSQIVKPNSNPDPPVHQGREKAILDAARRRFAHYGYNKVTMEEVAEEVGVVKGSIYYYFPTKEQLFKEVIRGEQLQFIARMKEILVPELSPIELIHLYVDKRLHYFQEILTLSQLDFQTWTRISSSYRDIFENFQKEEVGILQQIFERGMESGEFMAGNAQKLAGLFLHLYLGLWLRSMKSANYIPDDHKTHAQLNQEIKYFVEIFLRGISNNDSKENS
jgi:TetR/AcrR family transcriptional regulator